MISSQDHFVRFVQRSHHISQIFAHTVECYGLNWDGSNTLRVQLAGAESSIKNRFRIANNRLSASINQSILIHQEESKFTSKISSVRGKKGGLKEKYNKALQHLFDDLTLKLIKTNVEVTLKNLLQSFGESYDPLETGIPNCNDVYVDKNVLYWIDKNGNNKSISFRSLQPYLNRSKNNIDVMT